MTVADEVVNLARSKMGSIVRYKPHNTGKCEELIYKVLDEAKAEKGLKTINAQKGDIITFSRRYGRIIFRVTASAQGKEYFVQEDEESFSRGNHMAIASESPDKNGRIRIIEQNVGKSKLVTESPLNTRNKVSYSKKFPAGTSFIMFKREYKTLIESELTKEKAFQLINDSRTWKGLEKWFNSQIKYSFTISVSYSGSGIIESYRPQKRAIR